MDQPAPPQQSRPWTFRVQNIPSGTSAEQLPQYFIPEDRSGIEVRSLCPSVDPLSDTLTATVSFIVPQEENPRPPELLDPEASDIVVDDDFYGLTPLNSPQEPILADVIAVTGLAGHAFGSWACSPRQMWLRDFLPKDLDNNVRVLIYGYNSQLRNAASRSIIGDHVRMFKQRLLTLPRSARVQHRPLIFIGHSLGCLLIKKTLVEIFSSPTASHIADVPFIVFIGAPHRGLDSPSLKTVLGVEDLSKDIVDELGESSPTLIDLNENFARIAHQLFILSCYELRPTKTLIKDKDGVWKREGPATMMVSQNSAMLHSANEIRVPCHEDHSRIAKLRNTESSVYPIIRGHLQQALERHQFAEVSSLSDQRSAYLELPLYRPLGSGLAIERGGTPHWPPDPFLLPSKNMLAAQLERGLGPFPKRRAGETAESRMATSERSQILLHPSPLPDTEPVPLVTNLQPASPIDQSGCAAEVPSNQLSAQSPHLDEAAPLDTEPAPVTSLQPAGPIDHSESETEVNPSQLPAEFPRPPYKAESKGPLTEEQIAERDPTDLTQLIFPNESIEPSIDRVAEQSSEKHRSLDAATNTPVSPTPLHTSDGSRKLVSRSSEDHVVTAVARHSSTSSISDPTRNIVTPPPISVKRNSRTKFLDLFHKTSPKNETPEPYEFLKAAAENNVALLKELISQGGDVEARTSQSGDRTALHGAATRNCYEAADCLIKEGAKKDSRSKNNSTPLHEAAFAGSTEVAALLILAGTQLEVKNLEDEIPLSIASRRGHVEIVKELLDHDANFSTMRSDGKTPLQIAEALGNKEICQALRAKGAKLPRRYTKKQDTPQWPGLF